MRNRKNYEILEEGANDPTRERKDEPPKRRENYPSTERERKNRQRGKERQEREREKE